MTIENAKAENLNAAGLPDGERLEALKAQLSAETGLFGLTLSPEAEERFMAYMKLLLEWNEKMNLTAITEPAEVVTKHFTDSLLGLSALEKTGGIPASVRLIDVGCGAGFPGIPLKIAHPEAEFEVTLLDALQKRVGFLETVCRELDLKGVSCVHGRAEELSHDKNYREAFDVATSRALSNLAAVLEYTAPYVKTGGRVLVYKGPALLEERVHVKKALKALCLKEEALFSVSEAIYKDDLPKISGIEEHYIGVYRKIGPCALQYPRKQSKIKNNPLSD